MGKSGKTWIDEMSIRNFLDLSSNDSGYDSSRVVIISVPFDRTSSWKKGADKGPEAIINASAHVELYDIETDSSVYSQGIHTLSPVISGKTPEELIPKVTHTVSRCLKDNKIPVILGGNHTVSIGAVMGLGDHYKKCTVLQLDAHADLRDEYEGSRFNHACVMARVKELFPFVQVGIRSMDISEKEKNDFRRIFFAGDIYSDNSWIKECLSLLEENVYITIDLDVFDPGIMPSTGTPEPGGLSWYQVLALLKSVCTTRNVIGFDVVELCPGANHAPDFLAAKLVYKCLSYILS
ncbi:MAG: agmatinase [Spirochaetales bacterium]|nr:agmatinase [Spirochaetales bacterium]